MAKKNLFVLLFFGLMAITAINAQTTIPGGYVSGTWTASGSPYNIMGDITLHADSALTIEPGTDIIFQGQFILNVLGNLSATGTPTDSISFLPADSISGWGGILVDGPDIEWSYCNIKYVNTMLSGALEFRRVSSMMLSNCNISNNYGNYEGGAYI